MTEYSRTPYSFFKRLQLSFRALFGGIPTARSMDLPEGWPEWLIQTSLTADKWLGYRFERNVEMSPSRAQQFYISEVTHYKGTKAASKFMHEFIVVTIRDGLQDDQSDDKRLYLRYERYRKEDDDQYERASHDNLPSKLNKSSAVSSMILTNTPATRIDKLEPLSQRAIEDLERSVKAEKTFRLRRMRFEATPPTLLDLAAVLEAHSTLSTKYRLHTTMCYWFAGSTYEVLEDLYRGKSEDLLHAKKAGKLGPITGYRQIRDKQKDGDMSGLVKLVRSFEENGGDKKIREVSDAELREVVEKELQEIPSLDDLRQRSTERRDQVMAAIEKREREERERQLADQRAERASERLAAAEQQLAEERAERLQEQARRLAAEQQLVDLQRRLETLEAQVGRA